jgi:alkylation response protein AidB-like acyl-CoA dehydrogenase
MPQMSSSKSFLHSACELAPDIAVARDEIERARRLPHALAEKLRTAGLLQLWLPRELGGSELHPAEFVEVIEALAMADGAVGW